MILVVHWLCQYNFIITVLHKVFQYLLIIHYYAYNLSNYFIKNLIEQINPFQIQIVAGSFSEKFSYRSYVSVGNSAGYVRFTGLPENCMTGHMSFSGKFSWLCIKSLFYQEFTNCAI